MPKRKSRFLTVVFSFFPGCGHMYMGFMKMGLSLAGAFLFLLFLSSWLSLGPLMYIAPLLFFYSFFDCIQKCCAGDAEFAAIRDHWLFTSQWAQKANRMLNGKGRVAFGVLVLVIGLYLIFRVFLSGVSYFLPHEIYSIINEIFRAVPQVIAGLLIIAAGAYLIAGKRKGDDGNA